MHKYEVTKQISLEKIKNFQINILSDDVSAKQEVIVNGIKLSGGAIKNNKGGGILSFELSLPADKKPVITITYHKHLITKEVAESLGLERVEYDAPPRFVVREEV